MACTKNPIIEYINTILEIKSQNPLLSIKDVMTDFSFIELGENTEFCCPDCGPVSFVGPAYQFNVGDSNVSDLLKILGEGAPTGCCENYDINSLGFDDVVVQEKTERFSKACCNDFANCSLTFFNLMQEFVFSNPDGYFDLYIGGIHEYSTINNQSSLCLLTTLIESLDSTLKSEFLTAFYELNGITVYCNEGRVYAGTLNGFAAWW